MCQENVPAQSDPNVKKHVLDFLSTAAHEVTLDNGDPDNKVYHELRESYSWKDLINEVENDTAVGRRYVENIRRAANEEEIPLESFLLPGFGIEQ